MKFSYYMLIVTYFMAALGFYSGTLVEAIEPAFFSLLGVVLVISLVLNLYRKRSIPGRLWNLMAVAVLVFFIANHMLASQSLIVSASRFLTILLAMKLFDLNTHRDHFIIYAIVFFQMLAAAASTVSLVFFPLLVLFIVGSIFAMIILNLKKDFLQVNPEEDPPSGVFDLPFLASVVTVSVVSLTITFALFFLIPRMGVGFFEGKTLDTVKVSGFSDTVEIGSIGSVKRDSTIVMRVEVHGTATTGGGPLYLRGMALEEYDGMRWKRTTRRNFLLRKTPSGVFNVGRPSGSVLEQKILLEPLSTDVLFGATHPVRISVTFPNLWTDGSGSVHLPSPPLSRIEYRVWSSDAALPPGPEGVTPVHTDLSYIENGPAGARLKKLSLDVTDGMASAVDKAEAVKRYLEKNYSYTLDPGEGDGVNPIDDFLFYTKEGYCEHFASSFVLLLRAAGVPARLVTGFLQGEWNSLGDYYIVRQSDAHSWAEVYVEGEGWKTFDPTPPVGLAPPASRSSAFLYLDLMRLKWSRYIISFTFMDQKRIAENLEGHSARLMREFKSRFSTPPELPARALMLFGGIALLVAAVFMKTRGHRLAGTASRVPWFYIEMLRILEKKGIRRGKAETPMEFALRVGDPEVRAVTHAYEVERYGGRKLGGEEASRVRGQLETLKGPKRALPS